MVDTVAHQMGKRIYQLFNQPLIQFRVLAFQHQFNLFFQLSGKVTHHPRKPIKNEGNRHHPNGHDRLLYLPGMAFKLRQH